MPMGTARSKLQRKIIWALLNRSGENRCDHCDEWISHPEDLAITHDEPWLDNDPSLFWDFDNVAFMHLDCAAEHGDAARQHGGTQMNLVNISVENENGEWLPAVQHQGKLYVAGKKGDRYTIRVTNNTAERIEFVATVDGRDVISGEVGSTGNRGYVIDPHETHVLQGFRKTDDTVAAFRFGHKKDSYSNQMGTGGHVGVIGIAAYQERVRTYGGVLRGFGSGQGGVFGYLDAKGGVAPASMSFSSTMDSAPVSADVSVDVNVSARGMDMLRMDAERSVVVPASSPAPGRRGGQTRQRRAKSPASKKLRKEVKLGTEYGEELRSKVGHTTFTRRTTEPGQVWTCEYDTTENLRRREIPIDRVLGKPKTPSPFPADAEVAPGYAPPPPKRRYR